MAKDPAFLFYTSDFLTGTMLMSDEQVGKYIRLLCLQHQCGRLTKEHMLKICKSYDKEIFSKFAISDDNLYYNIRLEEESIKRRAYSESRRKNRSHMNNICKTYVPHMENENENRNIIINNNIINKKKTKKTTDDEFIESLKTNPAYKSFDVNRELSKMDAWLLAHPRRKKTRRFVVNWLNNVEKPMEIKDGKDTESGIRHI